MRFLRWWATATALWLLLSTTLARPDVIAAVLVGAAVGVIAEVTERAEVVHARIRLRWLRHLVGLPVQVAHDLGVLVVALVRPSTVDDVFREVPYDIGDDSPESVGKRALLGLAASLGPNTFVVGFDVDAQTVLVHQLIANEQVLPVPGGKFPPP